jgi:hypothetical protein
MNRDLALRRVAVVHVGLLAALLIAQGLLGFPHKGALLGGGLAGFSFVTFWVIARSITEPGRSGLAIALGILKAGLYLLLSAAILTGRLAADGGGFALGVSCFVAATVIVGLAGPVHGGAAAMARD